MTSAAVPSSHHAARGGTLLVDKPTGPTSHDVVRAARRALGLRSVGHCGTLDPLASGLLVLVVGEATRLASYVTAGDKAYRCTLRLGLRTDTDDVTGRELSRRDATAIDDAALREGLERLRHATSQIPPDYSAVHVDGQRAYALARQGARAALPPRPIELHRLELVRRDADLVELEIEASKGTYVRALVRDLGEDLGCGATVTALRRTRSGHLSVDEAVSLDALTEGGDPWGQVRAPATLFEPTRRLRLQDAVASALWRSGRAAHTGELPVGAAPWLAYLDDDVVAVVVPGEEGGLRVVRGFPAPS